VLRRREAPVGPGDRGGVAFALTTAEGTAGVYAGFAEAVLAPFVGRDVTMHAKLVDLRAEGYGRELWPGFIED
jgi:hypothetical protein